MERRRITAPVVDLLRAPDGPRDRQVLYGATVDLLDTGVTWSRIRAKRDGYEGFVHTQALANITQDATHWLIAPSSNAYTADDFKSPDLFALSFGSRFTVSEVTDRFAKTELGYVPKAHLAPLDQPLSDPVAVAERFVGTPYLWGGDSRFGIDCSGLVQAALIACNIPCPGDSGPQERALGRRLPAGSSYRRGDLLFWKGHVALVADPDTILHANAHHMAVVHEPLGAAIHRIMKQGDGPVTSHKRL